jgi:hypothetical protein
MAVLATVTSVTAAGTAASGSFRVQQRVKRDFIKSSYFKMDVTVEIHVIFHNVKYFLGF